MATGLLGDDPPEAPKLGVDKTLAVNLAAAVAQPDASESASTGRCDSDGEALAEVDLSLEDWAALTLSAQQSVQEQSAQEQLAPEGDLPTVSVDDLPDDKSALIEAIAPDFLPLVWQLDQVLTAVERTEPSAVHEYVDLCRRLAEAADMMEVMALRSVFLVLAVEMREYVRVPRDQQMPAFCSAMSAVHQALANYFSGGGVISTALQLQQALHEPVLHQGFLSAQIDDLALQLMVQSNKAMAAEPALPAPLSADDINLTVPADVIPSLYEAFLVEAPAHSETIQVQLAQLQIRADDEQALRALLRAVHTFKGSSATVGISATTVLCHALEELLGRCLESTRRLSSEQWLICAESADCLAEMVECLLEQRPAPAQALAVLRRLQASAYGCDPETIEIRSDAGPDDAGQSNADATSAPQAGGEPSATTNEPAMAHATMRVSARSIDELLRTGSELTALSSHAEDHYRHLQQLSHALEGLSARLQQRMLDLEHLADVSALPFLHHCANPDSEFDPLEIDQYHELHGQLRGLAESISDVNELSLSFSDELQVFRGWFQQQFGSNRQLQTKLLAMRMAPVKTLLPRLERCVRQAARLTGKTVRLDCKGLETPVDIDIIERIADSLVQLLRNAVDHGIEFSELRRQLGKDECGCIRLLCAREGSTLSLRINDDGAGLNFEKIRQFASQAGLIAADAVVGEQELLPLIWRPGFSTREAVTTTSGRGVGMDIVYDTVTAMAGTIKVVSQPGQGCSFELRLPLTMISVQVLTVRCAGMSYAIPSAVVRQIVLPDTSELQTQGEQQIYQYRDGVFRVHQLRDWLSLPVQSTAEQQQGNRLKPGLLLAEQAGGTALLLVDEVIGCRDVVLMRYGKYLQQAFGSLGMAQMADGQLIDVLDLAQWLQAFSGHVIKLPAFKAPGAEQPAQASQPTRVLIVEDSLSTRRSLQQLIGDAGYQVRAAKDGIEALDVMLQWPPDAVVTDLEMPRLNGLELTAQMRSGVQHDIPVIMLTSRTTQKHRDEATRLGVQAYLTKPYTETDVLMQLESVLERQA